MRQAIFLYQDPSFRTFTMPWGGDYNHTLRHLVEDPPPAQVLGLEPPTDAYRVANQNALSLLDSRLMDESGRLPRSACELAFHRWSDAEQRLKEHLGQLAQSPDESAQYAFDSNFVASWLSLIRFNLANLSLVDASTPSFMLSMVPGEMRASLRILERAIEMEQELEDWLNCPAPTRNVRSAMQEALKEGGGRPLTSAPASESRVFSLSQQNPFGSDQQFEELQSLAGEFLREIGHPPVSERFRWSSDTFPTAWGERMLQATELKRAGAFLESAKIYIDLTRTSGTVYTGLLANLYKTLASAGDLAGGMLLLVRAESMYSMNPNPTAVAAGIPSSFKDHLDRLTQSTQSESDLEGYLRAISGNPAYLLPRDYSAMVSELKEQVDRLQAGLEPLEKAKTMETDNPQKSGCYIATAVYGSYDCPEVRVLRRWRDSALMTTASGRAVVRLYYAVSPRIVRLLDGHPWFSRMARTPLEPLVAHLRHRGVSDEPYADA